MAVPRFERKIITLPGNANHTPEVVLARTLEKACDGHIKDVVIGIVWTDGTTSSDRSNISAGDCLLALHVAKQHMDDVLFNPDNIMPGDPP